MGTTTTAIAPEQHQHAATRGAPSPGRRRRLRRAISDRLLWITPDGIMSTLGFSIIVFWIVVAAILVFAPHVIEAVFTEWWGPPGGGS